MDTATIRLADEVFQAAADLPRGERGAYLERVCEGDASLREFVEQLLAEHDAGAGPLDTPLMTSPAEGHGAMPGRIGPYEVIRVLGEGGMAVVYEARQQNPSRTVALKVLRPGVVSAELMRRFQHEIEVLGQLQHPGIAHIYEAGIATIALAGASMPQPYFAMELIRGRTLTAFAQHHQLSDADKLELVARVCDAVQYAHQKGVIHRDLKPANILVEERQSESAAERQSRSSTDQGPQPKVLDFGVSRVADDGAATMNTEHGRLIGTLAYMSPEQVSGEVNETDTRSDVYSIGVVLYELLTGKAPFNVGGCTLPEGVRRVREEEPTRLSVHHSRFRGDVETIVARAMARDKARRYQSAAELGADLRRCLRGEAIEARRDSAIYVLRKSVRRYRGVVAAVSVVFLGLVAFASYAYGQARRFEALSEREHSARVAAESVKDFMSGIFDLANPGPGKGYDLTLTDMLDEATHRVQAGELAHDPAVEAEVRTQLAETYDNLELMDGAAVHRRWLADHQRDLTGENSPEHIAAVFDLARSHLEAGNPEAFELLEGCFDAAKRVLGDHDARTLDIQNTMANALMRKGRCAEALTLAQDALEKVTQLHGPESLDVGGALFNLAGIYSCLGRKDDMRATYERCVALMDKIDAGSITTTRIRWYFATSCLADQSLPEAERYLRETIDIAVQKRGEDHPETLATRRALAGILERQGRREEGIAMLQEVLQSIRGPKRWVLMQEPYAALDAAWMLRRAKRLDEGINELRTTRARYEKFRNPLAPVVIELMGLEAAMLKDARRNAEALAVWDDGAARMLKTGRDEARRQRWLKAAADLRAKS